MLLVWQTKLHLRTEARLIAAHIRTLQCGEPNLNDTAQIGIDSSVVATPSWKMCWIDSSKWPKVPKKRAAVASKFERTACGAAVDRRIRSTNSAARKRGQLATPRQASAASKNILC